MPVIFTMAGKAQQGMECISSFTLPELILPHFDGTGCNFSQAALTGGQCSLDCKHLLSYLTCKKVTYELVTHEYNKSEADE